MMEHPAVQLHFFLVEIMSNGTVSFTLNRGCILATGTCIGAASSERPLGQPSISCCS